MAPFEREATHAPAKIKAQALQSSRPLHRGHWPPPTRTGQPPRAVETYRAGASDQIVSAAGFSIVTSIKQRSYTMR
jgi:hypothetical protein